MNTSVQTRSGVFPGVSGWRVATIAFGLAIVVLLACYWQTAWSMMSVWEHDGTYQYAFLIFPLSVWVAFGLRDRVRANAPAPSIWGLVAVAGLVAIWYAGHMLTINLPQHFAFVALFPALVLTCWGWRALWVLKFPLAYLVVFAVPWGDSMVGPLQDVTARFAVHALDLTGVPVLLNGREIITPSAVWMVEAACSGVKFFIACTALGCLFAYLMYSRPWKRVGFVVFAAIAPIIANGLRVYFTVLIGETFGLHYATGTDHMIFGWQFFGTVLVVIMLIGWFFRDPLIANAKRSASNAKVAGSRSVLWLAAMAFLIVGPAVAAGVATVPASAQALHIVAPSLTGWVGPELASTNWKPSFKGASGQFHAGYRSAAGGDSVQLFHAVYTGRPRRGHNLITYGNNVYDPAHAQVLATASRRVQLADGAHIGVRELRLSDVSGPRLIWYWYCVDARCSASSVLAKLAQSFDVLRGRVPRTSVWALSVPVANSNTERAREDLRAFAEALPLGRQVAPSRVASAAPAPSGAR